jgi:hypothetical protein
MVKPQQTLANSIRELNHRRYLQTLEWSLDNKISQKKLYMSSTISKRQITKYFSRSEYKYWMITAVEQALMDILRVGPKRYVFHLNPWIGQQELINFLHLPDSQICMPWQEPSNEILCVHLKLT